MSPAMVIRPIWLAESVNHMAPSGPAAMSPGALPVGMGNSVMSPAMVIRPIWLAMDSVNHMALSGPAAMPAG